LRDICHAEGSAFFRLRSASRAGSPLLFGLAPRGVCLATAITGGAVGSYPTFSPLPACVPFVDIPKVFLRAITGFRSTGGLFSVALSVTRFSRTASPGVTRRVALCPQTSRSKGILRSSRSGVRTFLPLHVALGSRPASSAQPAIIQLTRHLYYSAQCQFPRRAQYTSSSFHHARVIIGQASTPERAWCGPVYLIPSNFSKAFSSKIVTPNSLALSYFDPGSVPTTT
jgi:hypothetical protein